MHTQGSYGQDQGAFNGVQHSQCVQRRILLPTGAAEAFNRVDDREICLVAVPSSADSCCFGLCCCPCAPPMAIPSGYFVLKQTWSKHQGEMDPGCVFCWPFWNKISHIVNKATVTYSAPSRQVPTADNVMVDINLSVTFSIGPDGDAAYDFVYKIGAERFDEFLSNVVEEGIRGLVYGVTHDRVNDLREEFAMGMLKSLSSTFAPYGVIIRSVKITETALPRSLASLLEETTTFRTRIAEKAKKHENAIRVLSDQASQELETICRTNARREQDLLAQCQRYEIEHKERVDELTGASTVREMEAKSAMEVQIARAKGDFDVAAKEGEREAEMILRGAQIECDKRKFTVEEQARVRILESEAELAAAKNNADALVAVAEAENNSTKGLETKRKYELEWQRLSVLKDLASTGRRFFSGPAGQSMLREMAPGEGKGPSSGKYF